MSSVETTPALKERERILKDDIMPSVLGMQRFLGKLNYGDQFFHRQLKGQLSWEFVDGETHTTFKPILLGEVATPTYGTLLKGKGNYKPPRDQPVSKVAINTTTTYLDFFRPLHYRTVTRPKTSSFFVRWPVRIPWRRERS